MLLHVIASLILIRDFEKFKKSIISNFNKLVQMFEVKLYVNLFDDLMIVTDVELFTKA